MMTKKKSSSSVILELKELVDHINNTIPDVPGKQRLVRMCQKETTHFESVSPFVIFNTYPVVIS